MFVMLFLLVRFVLFFMLFRRFMCCYVFICLVLSVWSVFLLYLVMSSSRSLFLSFVLSLFISVSCFIYFGRSFFLSLFSSVFPLVFSFFRYPSSYFLNFASLALSFVGFLRS